jgi:hypothetical protein
VLLSSFGKAQFDPHFVPRHEARQCGPWLIFDVGQRKMKAAFQVLKARPTIAVEMTRDSVCASDDCDAPHEKKTEVHSFLDPEAFARETSAGYLPSVAGVGHSWTCVLNGVKIAVVRESGIRALVHESPFADENHVHFVYHSAAF